MPATINTAIERFETADSQGATRNVDNQSPARNESQVETDNSRLPLKNPLSSFASYNCIFTLGILTNEQVIFPEQTYREGQPFRTLIRSGGTVNSQVQTKYENDFGITAEYFIDDVNIESVMAPTGKTRQTNATKITFTVLEPYSMGLFLQTMAQSAFEAGHTNYAKAPYLLSIEFVGYDVEGNAFQVPSTKRYFPMFFTGINFDVTAGGSQYSIEAVPYNESAFADEIQTVKENIDIKGETVADFLQIGEEDDESLTYWLNRIEVADEEADNKQTRDEYVVLFPTQNTSLEENIFQTSPRTGTATKNIDQTESPSDVNVSSVTSDQVRNFAEQDSNINKIGSSRIVKDAFEAGLQIFGRPEFEEENPGVFSRGNITISENGRRMTFKQGTRIQEIIEEIILLSEYGRNLAIQEADSEGMKEWFKIESSVYPITDTSSETQRGQSSRVFVYKIVPYRYNATKTSSPSSPAAGIEEIKRNAVKKYDYIYSGENDDILTFDIQFKTAFFQAIQFDLGQLGQDQKEAGANSSVNPSSDTVPRVAEGNQNQSAQDTQEALSSSQNVSAVSESDGGGTKNSARTSIARMFNEAIVNSQADLITANMEILGDPYYVADTGLGNYTARTGQASPNITEDGTINYQFKEVDILVNFKTPIDIGEDGFMQFPTIDSEPVAQFSGAYQVVSVINSFSQNKFTQTLELIRRRNQSKQEQQQLGDGGGRQAIEEGGDENRLSGETRQAKLSPGLPSSHPRAAGDLTDSRDLNRGGASERQSQQPTVPDEEPTGTGQTVPGSGSGPLGA